MGSKTRTATPKWPRCSPSKRWLRWTPRSWASSPWTPCTTTNVPSLNKCTQHQKRSPSRATWWPPTPRWSRAQLASLAPTRPCPSPVASCSSNNKSCSSCRSLCRQCRPCCRWCHRQCCQEAGRLFEESCSQALSQGPEDSRQEGPQVRQEARHKVLYQTVYQSCRQCLPPGRWFPCCRCCGCCHRRRL